MKDNENKNVDLDVFEGLRGDGTAKWYVIHTYSGHEMKVKSNLERIVENRGLQDLVMEIAVPTESILVIKDGRREEKKRKKFPGYVFVKMIVTNTTWYIVRNAQGVTGFLGHGSNPVPLTDEEVRRMDIERRTVDINIKVGDTVRVVSGPWEGHIIEVEDINLEKEKLRGMENNLKLEVDISLVDKI